MNKNIINKDDISSWWAENPMTYSPLEHGTTTYIEDNTKLEVEFGSKAFFENADREFIAWNTPLHNKQPFDRIFPFEKYKGKKVLEIGCGMGFMSSRWAANGAILTAVDLNPVAVEQTKRRFQLMGLDGTIRQTDANDLPFDTNEFDYVYSWGVLHHSPDIQLSIQELLRVLKPDGEYGIMLYNRNSLLHWYHTLYLEGWLHIESRFLTPLQLASRYGDGYENEGNPHTWPVTKKEFTGFLKNGSNNTKIKVLGTDVSWLFSFMLPGLSFIIPKIIMKSWARRWGWSLWAYGCKTID